MNSSDLAWRVEEACLNAWPALRQILLGGWLLRFSSGLTRRANSANPLAGPRREEIALITQCQALYRQHRQPAIFRLPTLVEATVDTQLAAVGYQAEGLSLVLYADTLPARRDPQVQLRARPSLQWFAAMAVLQQHTAAQASLYRRIVRHLAVPAAFATLTDTEGIVALAYGAIHDGLICYQSVVTDPRRRRRGYAGRLVMALAAWGAEHGGVGACLEVEAANAPARALYERLGFIELYRYHYRRQPTADR
ncbi:MAG TPA: GNAT family N-acetyltransferase [Stellaceae bacterium]|nr:GNAT family N-acetyltransferase [Stellaceae bacterium]